MKDCHAIFMIVLESFAIGIPKSHSPPTNHVGGSIRKGKEKVIDE